MGTQAQAKAEEAVKDRIDMAKKEKDETLELLDKIREEVEFVIDKHFENASMDRAYFNFALIVKMLYSDFTPNKTIRLIDDHDGYCRFCGKKTFYFDQVMNMYVCAKCLGHYLEEHKGGKH